MENNFTEEEVQSSVHTTEENQTHEDVNDVAIEDSSLEEEDGLEEETESDEEAESDEETDAEETEEA